MPCPLGAWHPKQRLMVRLDGNSRGLCRWGHAGEMARSSLTANWPVGLQRGFQACKPGRESSTRPLEPATCSLHQRDALLAEGPCGILSAIGVLVAQVLMVKRSLCRLPACAFGF